jgi:hypothetical protein
MMRPVIRKEQKLLLSMAQVLMNEMRIREHRHPGLAHQPASREGAGGEPAENLRERIIANQPDTLLRCLCLLLLHDL